MASLANVTAERGQAMTDGEGKLSFSEEMEGKKPHFPAQFFPGSSSCLGKRRGDVFGHVG